MATKDELNQQTQLQPVSYIDAAGQKQTGVADMPAADNSYYDQARDNYKTMYTEALAFNQDAAAKATEQAQVAAKAQREALTQGYQGTNRQLYRDYMQNQRTLPQQLAARGYTGGLSESARIRLANSYEEALAENERARMSQQASADAALQQRLYEIQSAAAQGDQNARQQLLSYNQALMDQQRQEQRQDYLTQQEWARSDQQYARELQRQDAANKAQTLAAAGDFSGYAALGYSKGEIDALTRAWLASNPDLVSAWIAAHPADAARMGITAPSSGESGGTYTAAAAAQTGNTGGIKGLTGQILEAFKAGATEDQIREAVQDEIKENRSSYTEGNTAWNNAVKAAQEAGIEVKKTWGPWVAGTRNPR